MRFTSGLPALLREVKRPSTVNISPEKKYGFGYICLKHTAKGYSPREYVDKPHCCHIVRLIHMGRNKAATHRGAALMLLSGGVTHNLKNLNLCEDI